MNALDVAYGIAGAAAAPWWMRKARSGWAERFGCVAQPAPVSAAHPRLLLHAVSVGEVNALRGLVPLVAGSGAIDVVVSVTTDTGIARARELFSPTCSVVRYPLDFSFCVRRFLDALRPDAVALVELELWPNFLGECARRGIPACVINGRLSKRSFRGYRRLRPLLGPMFASLTFAAVQDEHYAERFVAMGLPPERCLVTGSMKWDAAPARPGADGVPGAAELAASMGIDPSRPLIVAGSTGPGEEALLHRAAPRGVQLLCAPRKPERFNEAAAAMPGCVRRSAVVAGQTQAPSRSDSASDRFLLDTIGELRAAYWLADVVVVGRSFGSLYGSDPIEPAALGKPIVIGPAVSDFASIVEAFDSAGGIVRTGRDHLGRTLSDLIADPDRRAELASRALVCIERHRGATLRHAELLRSLPSLAPRPEAAPGGEGV